MAIDIGLRAAAEHVARRHLEDLDFRDVVAELDNEAWSKDEMVAIHRMALSATPTINP